mmetsp:Transcript_49272/g.56611  ORF Transcript_49272/g.56611 Transcript_49272/m.56611 type:complete len:109 (+) Transcript_49272:201-527(+)
MRLLRLIALMGLAVLPTVVFGQCDEDQNNCLGECCPEADWVCCDDGLYCAQTEDECPSFNDPILKSTGKTSKYLKLYSVKGDDDKEASLRLKSPKLGKKKNLRQFGLH